MRNASVRLNDVWVCFLVKRLVINPTMGMMFFRVPKYYTGWQLS